MLMLSDSAGKRHGFYVVDMHHHLGVEKNADGKITVRNLNPREADGSYDRLRSIFFGNLPYIAGLNQQLQDRTKFKFFHDPAAGSMTGMPPFMDCILEEEHSIQGDFKDTFIVDTIVAFPMHDSYRNDKEVEYRSSNERMGRLVNAYPHALRFIGFGRVNPKDGEKAVSEINRMAAEDGLCGLKLHPKSESFNIDCPEVVSIVKAAAMHGLPVIFHTDWSQHLEDIRSVADKVLTELALGRRFECSKKVRMVIGHCGFSFDKHMFEVLAHPCIYGELSGLHGEGPVHFVGMARKMYDPSSFIDAVLPRLVEKAGLSSGQAKELKKSTATDWTDKLCFGTDFPFLNQNGPIDTLTALFSKQLDLETGQIQNLLGLNALSMIPPKFLSPRSDKCPGKADMSPARRNPGNGLIRQLLARIPGMMKTGWTIIGLEFLLDGRSPKRMRLGQAILTMGHKEGRTRRFLMTSLGDCGFEAIHPLDDRLLPGLDGRFMRITDARFIELHLEYILGAGPWNDDDLPELKGMATAGQSH